MSSLFSNSYLGYCYFWSGIGFSALRSETSSFSCLIQQIILNKLKNSLCLKCFNRSVCFKIWGFDMIPISVNSWGLSQWRKNCFSNIYIQSKLWQNCWRWVLPCLNLFWICLGRKKTPKTTGGSFEQQIRILTRSRQLILPLLLKCLWQQAAAFRLSQMRMGWPSVTVAGAGSYCENVIKPVKEKFDSCTGKFVVLFGFLYCRSLWFVVCLCFCILAWVKHKTSTQIKLIKKPPHKDGLHRNWYVKLLCLFYKDW